MYLFSESLKSSDNDCKTKQLFPQTMFDCRDKDRQPVKSGCVGAGKPADPSGWVDNVLNNVFIKCILNSLHYCRFLSTFY